MARRNSSDYNPDAVARDAAEAVIKVLRDRDRDIRRALDAMHPTELRDLEDRIKQAIDKELPLDE